MEPSRRDVPRLPLRQLRLLLPAKPAALALLLQLDEARVAVVIPDTELFPPAHAVQLFAQRPILRRVKIEAPDAVPAIHRMCIRLHHRPQPLPQHEEVAGIQRDLPFMAIVHMFRSFRVFVGLSYRASLNPS